MNRLSLVLSVAAVTVSSFAGAAAALTVSTGNNVTDPLLMGARFRSLANTGGEEVYVGNPDLGVAANRNATDLNWVSGDNDFVLTYDAGTDTLTADVSNTSASSPYSVSFANALGGSNPGLNTILLQVVNRNAGSEVQLNDLVVAGLPVGDFAPGSNTGFQEWTLTDAPITGSFTVTGTLNLSGPFSNSQEASRVEFGFAVPEPASLSLVGLGALAMLRRRG